MSETMRTRARWGPYRGATLIVLAAAVLVAACGGSSDSDPRLRPFDEILDGEIEITNLTPSSATVLVTTTIPVVCSVVYGEDDSYGNQSTDLDMAGQGHTDHHPLLLGLAPDTVIHYRLQGTGPDGSVYISEPMTFRTPAAGEVEDSGDNLASLDAGARVVDASSTFGDSDTWRPENAIDGDPRTEWSSASDGSDAFIEIALAGPSRIDAVGLWTRTMGSSAQIVQFRVITDAGDVLGPFPLPDANELYRFEVGGEISAETLRFEVVDSSGGNTGVVELAVFGSAQ